MIKSWKDNNTLQRVRESEEAKTVVLTTTLTTEPGKTITFTISRHENENPTGKRVEKELAHPEEGRDPSWRHPAMMWTGSVLKAFAWDIEYGDAEPALCYELETSLSIDGKKVSSKIETYDSLEKAMKEISKALTYPERITFEGFDKTKGFNDIRKKDRDINSEKNEKILERIPLDIKKKCKEDCIKLRAKYEERDENGKPKYWSSPCKYDCPMSTGNEVNSGWCICQELHIKRPYEWNV